MYEDYSTTGSRSKKIYSTFNMAARREFSLRDCVKSYVIDIQRRFERGIRDADGSDYTVFRLDWVINILVRYPGIVRSLRVRIVTELTKAPNFAQR